MKFTAADLHVIDALDHIRSHPEMYTQNGFPNPAIIAHEIAGDAIVLGATDVRVFQFDGWWIVSANLDWLTAPCRCSASPRETFDRVLGFPKLSVNSMRHEVLATAYAEYVVSLSKFDRFVVSGNVADDHPIWSHMLDAIAERSVALRMPDDVPRRS
ncbi:hypothetical protein LOC67_24725 [Stieleria sp. JC731]|uniref:hypothetical protein n=1 Tax=Stieleria sp. JC731 TaxID=2894195 RepID=UPI001E5B6D0C|nr:hypothetical protein [Stieleria sp. JC731]MCC9603768.1 hypothetical protein [Stieleria sp. JC731]